MTTCYNIDWLIERFNSRETLEYLFFWGHTNKYGEEAGKFCFSQWYEAAFVVDDITYKTAEHWMMAHKALLFGDFKSFQAIIYAETPKQAKELGRQVIGFDEDLWNANRFDIVKKGNIHKFNQHPNFANFLLNSGSKILVEASPVDIIWGTGLDQDSQHINNPHFWRGLNLLGFALMEVRDFLNTFGHFSEIKTPVELPWKIYPGVHPYDMFWRMGKGEDSIIHFSDYYSKLSSKEKEIIKLTKPAPYEWKDFYDE